ncbi:uncharacterized protein [Hyperolius riggenbachi]|uniref:uncharacterized protein isoform X2 n=1 Tax=Hyperolius riggenbachi TaxID=752182 RepID=UPI0035A3D480
MAVLAKGLSFCPTAKFNAFQLEVDLFRYERLMKLKQFFHNRSISSQSLEQSTKFKLKSSFTPPGTFPSIETYIKSVKFDIQRNQQMIPTRNNLTRRERTCLQDLKNNDRIIIKPADKGGAVVIMNYQDYSSGIRAMLADSTSYTCIQSDPTPSTLRKLHGLLDLAISNRWISDKEYEYLLPKFPQRPVIYGLPKVHKGTAPLKFRPIISGTDSVTQPLARFVDFHLQPLVQSLPAYLKDTGHFLQRLTAIEEVSDEMLLCTMDISSLYTSIPNSEGLKAVKHFLSKKEEKLLPAEFILAGLELILTENCFRFERDWFRQCRGTAMGSSAAPAFANLFVGYLEETRVVGSPMYLAHVVLWTRYIDDVFVLWRGTSDELKVFIGFLNSLFEGIVFNPEVSETNVPFLDVMVTRKDGRLNTSVYRKPTDRNTLLHYDSAHPKHLISSLPISQFLRVLRICNEKDETSRELEVMKERFLERGYPEGILIEALCRAKEIMEGKEDRPAKNNLAFVHDYSPMANVIKKSVGKNLAILQSDVTLNPILHESPLFSYRASKSLREILVQADPVHKYERSTFTFSDRKGCYKCYKCNVCNSLITGKYFSDPRNGRKHYLKDYYNCNTEYCTYMLRCPCGLAYVGKTTNAFKVRFQHHRSDIRLALDALEKVAPQEKTEVTLTPYGSDRVMCSLSLMSFYPQDIEFRWIYEDKETLPSKKKIIQVDDEKVFDAISECIVPWRYIHSSLCVTWSHVSLQKVGSRALTTAVIPAAQQSIELTINSSGDVEASFSLSSFYPEDIQISWACGPTQEKKPSVEEVRENPDGTFAASSQCTIPGRLFEDPQFTVRVSWNHVSMENPEHRQMSVRDPAFPWHPNIKEISPLILQVHRETTVVCKISSYFPEDLKVTWIEKKGGRVNECNRQRYRMPLIENERMADNTFTCSPSLSFTPTSDKEELEIICRVEHPSLEQPIERSTGPPRVNVAPLEKTEMTLTPYGSDRVTCSLSLMRFFPQDIHITWIYEDQEMLPSKKKITQVDDEKVFDAISECIVPWRYIHSSLRVTWSHDSLQEPGSRALTITEFPWIPKIEDLDTSNLLLNKISKLQCRISGYFPPDLSVSWYRRKGTDDFIAVTDNKYNMADITHQIQPDNTYSCTASLLITPTLADQGSEFICRVQHPSLERPLERGTGPVQVMDFPWRPHIEQLDSSGFILNRESTIQYKISSYISEELTVSWHRKQGGGREEELANGDQYRMPQITHQRQEDNTYSCTARLLITPTLADQGSEFICRVQPPSLEHPLERSTGSIQVMVSPQVIEPVRFSISDTGEVQCALTLRRFYPRDISITWSSKGGQSYLKSGSTPTESKDGTCDVTSVCTLPRPPCFPVHVTWEHQAATQPQSIVLSATDLPWRPHIEELQESDITLNKESKIHCNISGYCLSKALTVSWWMKKSDNTLVPLTNGSKYKTQQITHCRQEDKTYSCTASLLITPTQEDQGSKVICRVQHPSLEKPIEKTTKPLTLKTSMETEDRPQETPLESSKDQSEDTDNSQADSCGTDV